MKPEFRHKKTGGKVKVNKDCGSYVTFRDLPERDSDGYWIMHCMNTTDFLDLYEPVPKEQTWKEVYASKHKRVSIIFDGLGVTVEEAD